MLIAQCSTFHLLHKHLARVQAITRILQALRLHQVQDILLSPKLPRLEELAIHTSHTEVEVELIWVLATADFVQTLRVWVGVAVDDIDEAFVVWVEEDVKDSVGLGVV